MIVNRSQHSIALQTLGCPKNLVDAEYMSGSLQDAGYQLLNDMSKAEAIVINTCAFITSAKEEAISAILEAATWKEEGLCRFLIVSGCLAQRYAAEIRRDLPEVDAILGVSHYKDIVHCLDHLFSRDDESKAAYVASDFDAASALAHLHNRRNVSSSYYAYLKIAEGCSHACAYCAIPAIRGPFQSRPMEDVLREAESLAEQAIKEVILVAQDSSAYGRDLYKRNRFPELLAAIAGLGFARVYFLYGYVDGISDELLHVIKNHANIVPYFDLPIQHAADSVLKRMRRRDRQADLREAFTRIRSAFPEAVLRTSIIVGFPGETEEEFNELLGFIEEMRFDHAGVFIYSAEEGTPAATMPDQIAPDVAERRYACLMDLQNKISTEQNQRHVGKVYPFLLESVADDGIFYMGRITGQAPEVDSHTCVLFSDFEPVAGAIYDVRIVEAGAYELIGVCTSESAE